MNPNIKEIFDSIYSIVTGPGLYTVDDHSQNIPVLYKSRSVLGAESLIPKREINRNVSDVVLTDTVRYSENLNLYNAAFPPLSVTQPDKQHTASLPRKEHASLSLTATPACEQINKSHGTKSVDKGVSVGNGHGSELPRRSTSESSASSTSECCDLVLSDRQRFRKRKLCNESLPESASQLVQNTKSADADCKKRNSNAPHKSDCDHDVLPDERNSLKFSELDTCVQKVERKHRLSLKKNKTFCGTKTDSKGTIGERIQIASSVENCGPASTIECDKDIVNISGAQHEEIDLGPCSMTVSSAMACERSSENQVKVKKFCHFDEYVSSHKTLSDGHKSELHKPVCDVNPPDLILSARRRVKPVRDLLVKSCSSFQSEQESSKMKNGSLTLLEESNMDVSNISSVLKKGSMELVSEHGDVIVPSGPIFYRLKDQLKEERGLISSEITRQDGHESQLQNSTRPAMSDSKTSVFKEKSKSVSCSLPTTVPSRKDELLDVKPSDLVLSSRRRLKPGRELSLRDCPDGLQFHCEQEHFKMTDTSFRLNGRQNTNIGKRSSVLEKGFKEPNLTSTLVDHLESVEKEKQLGSSNETGEADSEKVGNESETHEIHLRHDGDNSGLQNCSASFVSKSSVVKEVMVSNSSDLCTNSDIAGSVSGLLDSGSVLRVSDETLNETTVQKQLAAPGFSKSTLNKCVGVQTKNKKPSEKPYKGDRSNQSTLRKRDKQVDKCFSNQKDVQSEGKSTKPPKRNEGGKSNQKCPSKSLMLRVSERLLKKSAEIRQEEKKSLMKEEEETRRNKPGLGRNKALNKTNPTSATDSDAEQGTKSAESKLIYPKPCPDGMRRSQRVRLEPIEWYKNENVIYERCESGAYVISGLQPSQGEAYLAEKAVRKLKHQLKFKTDEAGVSSGSGKRDFASQDCGKSRPQKRKQCNTDFAVNRFCKRKRSSSVGMSRRKACKRRLPLQHLGVENSRAVSYKRGGPNRMSFSQSGKRKVFRKQKTGARKPGGGHSRKGEARGDSKNQKMNKGKSKRAQSLSDHEGKRSGRPNKQELIFEQALLKQQKILEAHSQQVEKVEENMMAALCQLEERAKQIQADDLDFLMPMGNSPVSKDKYVFGVRSAKPPSHPGGVWNKLVTES